MVTAHALYFTQDESMDVNTSETAASSRITKIQTACEYQALKDCLEKNNWRKEKCEKEWLEFENLCSKNKQ